MLFPINRNKVLRISLLGTITWILSVVWIHAQAQQALNQTQTVTNCPRSQKQAEIWYFGDKAGIDFRSGTATPLLDQNVMLSFKSSAVISDSSGNLLFFTDSKKVWNRDFQLMTNANSLEGDLGVEQPCIIVPVPNNPEKYYIFTVDVMIFKPDNSFTTNGCKYTIIDMTMWNGTGDARDTMNMPLLSPVCQKLTALQHANGYDYWVILHQWDSDAFYAYQLTSSGISSPVVSHAGSVMGGGYANLTNAYGYMKASPDGSKIGLAISGLNKVEMLDFNNSTGVVSNAQTYTTSDPGISPYGVEFSSDSKKFYVSLLQIVGNGPPAFPSRIYQFDLNVGFANPTLIDTIPSERIGGLQLATDGRIYVSRTVNVLNKRDSLDVIYNPTRSGVECNYSKLDRIPKSRFSLDGRKCIYGLPNFIQSYFNLPMFYYDSVCHQDVTRFTIRNRANVDTVLWQFGDGATSTSQTPIHVYASPGDYMVKLTETYNGINYIDSSLVTIHPLPPVELGDTILLYSGASILLHAGGGYVEYLWSNTSTDSIISVDTGGDYWVKVKDSRCCYNADTVYVNLFKYYVPNAFTPNGDGTNDVFKVIGKYENIALEFYVYNRWGQLVFTSTSLTDGWDGTFGGQPSPPDTYVWIANIKFLGSDITTKGDVVYKGTVTLVR